jgi:flagellar biosynthesis/type III secretory pathway protein FliH
MDFDYYFKKYDEEYGFNDSELCGFEIGFEAGQQSKQEEVNKRQAQLDKLQKEIDALREMVKKLIDNTVLSIDDELEDQANNLLRGNQK